MTEIPSRSDIKAAMVDAGFSLVYVPLTIAREIMSEERERVWCEDIYGQYRYGRPLNRVTASYYAGQPLVTAFDLSDIASNCEYSSASTWSASNLRSLTRDYPNRVIELGYMNGQVGIVLLASLDEDLTDILTGLRVEYPIYDEDDHSKYEMELAEAAWGQYLQFDVSRAVQGALDEAGFSVDLSDLIADDELRELFYQSGYESGETVSWTDSDGTEHSYVNWEWIEYESEGGSPDSVIFPKSDEVIARIADIAVSRARKENYRNARIWVLAARNARLTGSKSWRVLTARHLAAAAAARVGNA